MARENLSGNLSLSFTLTDSDEVDVVKKYLAEHHMTAGELVRVSVSRTINYEIVARDGRTSDYDLKGASAVKVRLSAWFDRIRTRFDDDDDDDGRLAVKKVWKEAAFLTSLERAACYDSLLPFAIRAGVKVPEGHKTKILAVTKADAESAPTNETA